MGFTVNVIPILLFWFVGGFIIKTIRNLIYGYGFQETQLPIGGKKRRKKNKTSKRRKSLASPAGFLSLVTVMCLGYIFLNEQIEMMDCTDDVSKLSEQEQFFIIELCQAIVNVRSAKENTEKEAIKTKLDDDFCRLFRERPITNWSGKVKTISKSWLQKQTHISIELGSKIEISTATKLLFQNELAKTRPKNTIVKSDDPLYGKILSMKHGDNVIFSGTFVTSTSKPCMVSSGRFSKIDLENPSYWFEFDDITLQ